MARAATPPKHSSQTHYYISGHAIEQIRSRFNPAAHLSDGDLRRVLDDAVQGAIKHDRFKMVVDSHGDETKLVHMSKEFLDQSCVKGEGYALIKPDEHNPGIEAVVTVYTPEMAEKRYEVNAVSSNLRDQLKNVTIPIAQTAPNLPTPKVDDTVWLGVIAQEIKLVGSKEDVLSWVQGHPRDGRIFKEVKLKVRVELDE